MSSGNHPRQYGPVYALILFRYPRAFRIFIDYLRAREQEDIQVRESQTFTGLREEPAAFTK